MASILGVLCVFAVQRFLCAPSLGAGGAARWITAAWTLWPAREASDPLTLVLAHGSFSLPCGDPVFRTGILAGLLLSASWLLLSSFFYGELSTSHHSLPPLLHLEEARWNRGLAALAAFLCVLAPWPLGRSLFWNPFPAHLFAWALALQAARSAKTRALPRRWAAAAGAYFLLAYLLPRLLLAALRNSSPGEAFRDAANLCAWPSRPVSWNDLGAWPFLSPLALLAAAALLIRPAKAWGLHRSGVRGALWILLPLSLAFALKGSRRGDWSGPDLAVNLLKSLPAESRFIPSGTDIRDLIDFQQRVMGERADVAVLPPGNPAGMDSDTPDSFPGGYPNNAMPMGLVYRFLPGGFQPAAPAAQISQARLPRLLFEGQPGRNGHRAHRGAADPYAAAHRRLGELFAKFEILDEAETEYLDSLALSPEDPETNRRLARLILEEGDGPRALALFDRAWKQAPLDAPLAEEYARAQVAEGFSPEALNTLGTALERAPGAEAPRMFLADLYEKSGRPRDAVAHWAKLRADHPENKTYHWRLTQAYMMAQEYTDAFSAIETYLRLPLTETEKKDAENFRALFIEKIGQKVN